MLCFQRFINELIAIKKFASLILVADFDVFESERRWVSRVSALRAPVGIRGSVRIVDDVEKVVANPTHFGHWDVFALAEDTRLAAEADPERLGAEVLAKLEILEQPHAVCTAIIPSAPSFGTVFRTTDRELPVVGRFDGAAFHGAAAGKTDETGLEVGDHPGDVGPQAVRTILPGVLRKERDEVQPHSPLRLHRDHEARLALGLGGGERGHRLRPTVANVLDRDCFRTRVAGTRLRVGRRGCRRNCRRARTERANTRSPALTPMPKNPPLATPMRPVERSSASSRRQ